MPFDGTNNEAFNQLQRWKEIRQIIWDARNNMAIPGRWTRFNYGGSGSYCCASHIALAGGAREDFLNAVGIKKALAGRAGEAVERLGGLETIIGYNDNAIYDLKDVLSWLDWHIGSLTADINALQRELVTV